MRNNINQRATVNVESSPYTVGANPYGPYNTDFGYWISELVQVEDWFGSQNEANQYYNSPSFYGQMQVTTGNNPDYTYIGGDIASLWEEYQSVYSGGIQAQGHPVGTTQAFPDESYDPQQVLFQLSGAILGSISTPQSITYNPLANLHNGDVQPACTETAAAILATDINTFGQLLIEQLDNEQLACLESFGYYTPPSPCDSSPFTSLSPSEVQNYASMIVSGNGCDADPYNWLTYLESQGVNTLQPSMCANDINNINVAIIGLCGSTGVDVGGIYDDLFGEGGIDVIDAAQPTFDITDCPDCNCDCPDPCPDVNTGGGIDPNNPYGCQNCVNVQPTDPCFFYCWSNGLIVQSAQSGGISGGFVKPNPVKPFKPYKPYQKKSNRFNGRKR